MKSPKRKQKHHERRSIPRRKNRSILSTSPNRQRTPLTGKKALEAGPSRRCDPLLRLPTGLRRHSESVLPLVSVVSLRKVADHLLLRLTWRSFRENALYTKPKQRVWEDMVRPRSKLPPPFTRKSKLVTRLTLA